MMVNDNTVYPRACGGTQDVPLRFAVRLPVEVYPRACGGTEAFRRLSGR